MSDRSEQLSRLLSENINGGQTTGPQDRQNELLEALNLFTPTQEAARELSDRSQDLSFLLYENIIGEQTIEEQVRSLMGITDAQVTDEDLQSIVSSLTTRIGSVLLIIFLVQILAGLYRYSARMAAHLESQADVLSLGELSPADAMTLLSTENVRFEKTPRPPADIKEIVQKPLMHSTKIPSLSRFTTKRALAAPLASTT